MRWPNSARPSRTESEINRLYRAVKLLQIGAGTTEVRKLIIAGELLR